MVIVWDEGKRAANIAKHGLDFADLTPEFFELSLIVAAKLNRYLAIGRTGKAYFAAVVFAPLGAEAISVISMRPASKKERDYARKNA
ncbi:BrnT family toxin [Rhodoblastus sp.]|uniref:BrnT family toxin n=1 Tax=Rhodoblastus sp. TaxID=1962975 RepID=UPI003F97C878